MNQLTYIKKNTLEWWEVNEPQLEAADDVIARPIAAARCDGDKVFLFHDVTSLLQAGLAIHYIDPVAMKLFGDVEQPEEEEPDDSESDEQEQENIDLYETNPVIRLLRNKK